MISIVQKVWGRFLNIQEYRIHLLSKSKIVVTLTEV